MTQRIHWLCWQPTPYNDYLFQALAAAPGVDLLVHYRDRSLGSHPWQTKLRQGYASRVYVRRLGLDWRVLGAALAERNSLFVVAGWNEPTVLALVTEMALLGRRYALWTDTPDSERRRHWLKDRARSAWLRLALSRASWTLGTGARALERLAAMGAPRDRLVNFPFSTDLDRFKPNPAKAEPDGNVVFLSSGRLVNSHKGYDCALRAFGQVARSGQVNFRYRLAGVGPDEAQLRALAQELGIADRVEFLGWLEPDALVDFYASGHVFLHPSHFDPFPNAVLEAMACGLPVVGSSEAGSVLERVAPGRSGLVHAPGDDRALAAHVASLLARPQALRDMGQAARQTAEQWPVERAVQTIVDIAAGRTP